MMRNGLVQIDVVYRRRSRWIKRVWSARCGIDWIDVIGVGGIDGIDGIGGIAMGIDTLLVVHGTIARVKVLNV